MSEPMSMNDVLAGSGPAENRRFDGSPTLTSSLGGRESVQEVRSGEVAVEVDLSGKGEAAADLVVPYLCENGIKARKLLRPASGDSCEVAIRGNSEEVIDALDRLGLDAVVLEGDKQEVAA